MIYCFISMVKDYQDTVNQFMSSCHNNQFGTYFD